MGRTARFRGWLIAAISGVLLIGCTEGQDTGTGGAGVENGEGSPVTLSVVTSFPGDAVEHDGFWVFVERLEENAPWITIDHRGGPEVIDPLQLVESATSGAIDMAVLPQAFYVQQARIADMMSMTPYLPMEERENGLFEIYQEWHRNLTNTEYLGKAYAGVPMQLFTVDPFDEPDFGGRTIRVSPAAAAVVEGLGGEVVNLQAGEIYTALERGTVDGFGWASVGVEANGWQDVVGYQLEPRFGEATISVLLNSDRWNELDPVTQQALADTMAEVEPEIVDLYRGLAEEEQQAYLDAGVDVVSFEGDDATAVLRAYYNGMFDMIGYDDIASEEPLAEEMRELFEDGYGDDYEDAVAGPMYYGDSR